MGSTGEVPPGTQCTRSHNQVLDGYEVSNRLTVKVRDLESVGKIIDSVIDAAGDIVRINGINFSIEDSKVLEDEARAAAVADLKAKAARLAELAGVELGPLIYLSETGGPAPFSRFDERFQDFAYASQAQSTSIRPGELEAVVTVAGVFEIAETGS